MLAAHLDDKRNSTLTDQSGIDRIVKLHDTLDAVDRFTAAIRDLYWSAQYEAPSIPESAVLEARGIVKVVVRKYLDELVHSEQPWAAIDDADMFDEEGAITDLASAFYNAPPPTPTLKDHRVWEDLACRSAEDQPLTAHDFKMLNELAEWLTDGILSELDGPANTFT